MTLESNWTAMSRQETLVSQVAVR